MPPKTFILPAPGEAPTGLCECGCGQPTNAVATYTRPESRRWTGFPAPYLRGHEPRRQRSDKGKGTNYQPKPGETMPSGLCECGCGDRTEVAGYTLTRWRHYKGHHLPFIKGHHAKHNQLSERGPNHPRWKGGRWKHKSGYIYVYMPDHPDANADSYVLEHHWVAEQTIGRRISPGEHVHHQNHQRDDNRPENLMVMTKAEHSRHHGGQTFAQYHADHPDAKSESGKKGADARWKK